MKYNPRDGKLWRESKRYHRYIKIAYYLELLIGRDLFYKIIYYYNIINPPLPTPEF